MADQLSGLTWPADGRQVHQGDLVFEQESKANEIINRTRDILGNGVFSGGEVTLGTTSGIKVAATVAYMDGKRIDVPLTDNIPVGADGTKYVVIRHKINTAQVQNAQGYPLDHRSNSYEILLKTTPAADDVTLASLTISGGAIIGNVDQRTWCMPGSSQRIFKAAQGTSPDDVVTRSQLDTKAELAGSLAQDFSANIFKSDTGIIHDDSINYTEYRGQDGSFEELDNAFYSSGYKFKHNGWAYRRLRNITTGEVTLFKSTISGTSNNSITWVADSSGTIYSDADFLKNVTRISANLYKFNDGLKNVKFIDGSFNFSAILLGGDTWGVLQTNQVTGLSANGIAIINIGTGVGAIEANTPNARIEKIKLIGSGSVQSNQSYCFMASSTGVVFRDCFIDSINSNVVFDVFKVGASGSAKVYDCDISNITLSGSGTVSIFNGYDTTKKIEVFNCSIIGITQAYDGANTIYGVIYGNRIRETTFKTITFNQGTVTTGINLFTAVENSTRIHAIIVDGISGTNLLRETYLYIFNNSEYISSSSIKNISITSSSAIDIQGYKSSNRISLCEITGVSYSTTSTALFNRCFGFMQCKSIDSCEVINIICNTSTISASLIIGFNGCFALTCCNAENLVMTNHNSPASLYGYNVCSIVSASSALSLAANGTSVTQNIIGFVSCQYVSSCYTNTFTDPVGTGVAYGFYNCLYMASSYSSNVNNPGNNYVDTTDTNVPNKTSTGDIWT